MMAGAFFALAIGCALALCLALNLVLISPGSAEAATKRPGTTHLTKTKPKTSKTTVYWKRAKRASGYQIKYSIKRSMKNAKSKRVLGKSKRKTSLRTKAGKTYWAKIRAYKKVHGKRIYSKWSKRIKFRTPKRSSTSSSSTSTCAHSWTKQAITRFVVTSPAWSEMVAIGSVYYCNGCDAEFENSDAWIDHSDQMIDQGDLRHDSYRGPVVIYEEIDHSAEGHDEIIGYTTRCTKCGEIVK